MQEASKTRCLFGELEKKIFKGSGIDIGCGDDPIYETVRRFDMEHGDANNITRYVSEKFDYVFSAHCLEHMIDPRHAILEWWQLVKDNGFLYIVVPDEDLYEQGIWPSKFNADHKHTFTIYKRTSWSPVSINVVDLIQFLDNAKIIQIKLQDQDYNYDLASQEIDQTLGNALAQICFIIQKIEKPLISNIRIWQKWKYWWKWQMKRLSKFFKRHCLSKN